LFVSAAEKFGVEVELLLIEPPADDVDDGVLEDEDDGVLDDDEDDCATASVDSAKSTAAVVTLRVLDMNRASKGLVRAAPALRASVVPTAPGEGPAVALCATSRG
jgi:hypothetical protein